MNAIFIKEFRGLLRERRGWLIPVIESGLLGGIACLTLAITPTGSSDVPRVGQFLGGVVAVVQMVALHVFAPLVGATAIAGERERGTFQVLLAAPVDRRAIGTGKLAAAILYCLVLLSASLPVSALSYALGGMDAAAMLGLYATHFVVATMLVALGLAVSTLFQRTWTASFVALASAAGLILLTVILAMLFEGVDDWDSAFPPVLLFNPGLSLFLFFDGNGEWATLSLWWGHLGAMLVVAAGALAFALRKLGRQRS